MLQTHRTRYGSGLPLDQVRAPFSLHLPTGERLAGALHGQPSELAIDDALAASFPASDPPGWNPGLARSGSIDRLPNQETNAPPMPARDDTGAVRPLIQALISLAGAVGVALVVPFAILLVGLPIALAVRGLLEVLVWFFSAIG